MPTEESSLIWEKIPWNQINAYYRIKRLIDIGESKNVTHT